MKPLLDDLDALLNISKLTQMETPSNYIELKVMIFDFIYMHSENLFANHSQMKTMQLWVDKLRPKNLDDFFGQQPIR